MKERSGIIFGVSAGLLAAGLAAGCAGGHVSAESPKATHAATHEAVASKAASPTPSPSTEVLKALPAFGAGENTPLSPGLRKAAAALLQADKSHLPPLMLDHDSDTFYISQASYHLPNGDTADVVFSMTKDSFNPENLAQARVLVTDSSNDAIQVLNVGTEGYDSYVSLSDGTHTTDAIFPEANGGSDLTTPEFCETTNQGQCLTVADTKAAVNGLMSAVAADFNSLAEGDVNTQSYAPDQPSESATFPAPNF